MTTLDFTCAETPPVDDVSSPVGAKQGPTTRDAPGEHGVQLLLTP